MNGIVLPVLWSVVTLGFYLKKFYSKINCLKWKMSCKGTIQVVLKRTNYGFHKKLHIQLHILCSSNTLFKNPIPNSVFSVKSRKIFQRTPHMLTQDYNRPLCLRCGRLMIAMIAVIYFCMQCPFI